MKNKKIAAIEEEYKILSLKEDIRRKRTDTLIRLLVPAAAFYSVLIALILPFFTKTNIFTFDFQNGAYETARSQKIEELNKKVETLEKDVTLVRTIIDKEKSSLGVSGLEAEINQLKTKQQALSETILEDADKALTAKLIREKQNSLEAKMDSIQDQVSNVDGRVDNLLMTLLIIPLGGVALSLITGLIYYLFNKNKRNNETA